MACVTLPRSFVLRCLLSLAILILLSQIFLPKVLNLVRRKHLRFTCRDHSVSQLVPTVTRAWSVNVSRDVSAYVSPNETTTLLKPTWSCSGSHAPFLIVIVCSALQHLGLRSTIRETWGSQRMALNESVRIVFMFGTPPPNSQAKYTQKNLLEESILYDDLIQESFVDTYHNLTLKSVFLLKWVHKYCASARFIVKSDDDVFINIPPLVQLLKDMERHRSRQLRDEGTIVFNATLQRPFLLGQLVSGEKRNTDLGSKWFVPEFMYSGRTYPPYMSGPCYVMSADAIVPLFTTALSTPYILVEDVYITGICAQKGNVNHIHVPSIRLRSHTHGFIRRREVAGLRTGRMIALFPNDEMVLRHIWEIVRAPSHSCVQCILERIRIEFAKKTESKRDTRVE